MRKFLLLALLLFSVFGNNMRITTAQNLRKIRDESKQPSEIYGKVIDVDYLNKSVLVQIGSKATWVQVVSSLLLGTKQNPVVVPGGQVQLARWGGDSYVAASYIAKTYLPSVGVGMRMSSPVAYLDAPQWLQGYPRVNGTTLEGSWTSVVGATGYYVWANTTPSPNGAWRIPKGNPGTYNTTQFSMPYNSGGSSELFKNGFESGDFTGWTTYDNSFWSISSSEKHTGSYGARVYGTVEAGGSSAASLHSNSVSINPSGSITFTIWHKVSSVVGTGYLSLGYNWLNSDGSSQGDSVATLITSTGAWTQFNSGALSAPASAYGFRLHIRGTAEAAGSVTAYIDDATINGFLPISTEGLVYAVSAFDKDGNSSPFSSWLEPAIQSAAVGSPDSTITEIDYANALMQSSNYVANATGFRVSPTGVEGACFVSNTAPSAPFPGLLWFDTTTNIFKVWTP